MMSIMSEVTPPVPWAIVEQAASRYEAQYTSRRGQRADQAERVLLT